mmetsp:Transcript_4912/g.16098  ORF Transcript_4912/g.16098 Transcript_4912/m.16098 type:complete len:691 (-) Transcript_4912:904-2976(-)
MRPLLLAAWWCVSVARSTCRRSARFTIDDCGAVSDDESFAVRNGEVIAEAFRLAEPGDRIVVPYGRRYFVIPAGVHEPRADVTLEIRGELAASFHTKKWPDENSNRKIAFLGFQKPSNLTITGGGLVNGRGHRWWWHFALNLLDRKRPALVRVDSPTNVTVSNLAFIDSPRFHLHVLNATKATVRNVTILVDWRAQKRQLPVFPFNTDGVDVGGKQILVEDVTVSNWDDVIAVKPTPYGCTRNVTVRNITSLFGGGLSVGSVGAGPKRPCVRDVLFEKCTMYRPFKGLYVKTGGDHCKKFPKEDDCSGVVSDVTYEDIRLHGDVTPTWWRDFEKRERRRGGATSVVGGGKKKKRKPFRLLNTPTHIGESPRLFGSLGSFLLRASTRATWRRQPSGIVHVQEQRQEEEKKKETKKKKTLPKKRKKNFVSSHAPPWSCRTTSWLFKGLCMSWPLYVGPQQQMEPYLYGSPGVWAAASTSVTVANVTVRRFTASGGSWPEAAAAIRCHPDNPCTGVQLQDVHIDGAFGNRRAAWICDKTHAASGSVRGRVVPHPGDCLATEAETTHESTRNDPVVRRQAMQAKLSFAVAFLIAVFLLAFALTACCRCLSRPCRRQGGITKDIMPQQQQPSLDDDDDTANERRLLPRVVPRRIRCWRRSDATVSLPLNPRGQKSRQEKLDTPRVLEEYGGCAAA